MPPVSFHRAALSSPIDLFKGSWTMIRDQYWLFVGIVAVAMLVGGAAPLGVLMGPMMCGVFGCLRDKKMGQTVRFERLFDGFRSAIFVPSLVATLIMMASSLVVLLPIVILIVVGTTLAAAAGAHTHSDAASVVVPVMVLAVFLVLFVLALWMALMCGFVYPLILDRGVDGVEAVKLSVRASLANVGGLLGLALASCALSLVGVLCCYVGAFLVLPVTMGAQMLAYERVFGWADAAVPPA
jgi:uncharacterized membrane protein